MSQFEFSLATLEHDAQLRQLLRSTPTAGRVSLAFAREPSYFAATPVDGRQVQVGVVKERDTGRIIGMGSRAVGTRFVNGRPTPVGYLGGLRLLPAYRGRAGLLARGYRYFRTLHEDGEVAFYLTTIAAANKPALEALTAGRAGLPTYEPWGEFFTLAINPAHAAARGAIDEQITVRRATHSDRDLILEFLKAHGPRRQFFPAYEPPDLFADGGWLSGLRPGDVQLAFRTDRLVGTLGAWDQHSFKQIRVHGYDRWLALSRPLYNAAAALQRRPKLPAVGDSIRGRYGALLVVADDDQTVFRRLLGATGRDLVRRGETLLLLGLHVSDPLLPLVRDYSGEEYVTLVYLVYWRDSPPPLDDLRERVPYLELGCL
jgi:hypothetical protein